MTKLTIYEIYYRDKQEKIGIKSNGKVVYFIENSGLGKAELDEKSQTISRKTWSIIIQCTDCDRREIVDIEQK